MFDKNNTTQHMTCRRNSSRKKSKRYLQKYRTEDKPTYLKPPLFAFVRLD